MDTGIFIHLLVVHSLTEHIYFRHCARHWGSAKAAVPTLPVLELIYPKTGFVTVYIAGSLLLFSLLFPRKGELRLPFLTALPFLWQDSF